jgi:hypothetical protein
MKLAGAVSLALIANRMDSVHKTVGDAAIGVTRTFDPEGGPRPTETANHTPVWVAPFFGIEPRPQVEAVL